MAEEKELSSLPYIKFHLAKSIAAYRFQHGPFASVEDLRELALMDEALFQKIKPYLTVKD
jgi:DNA uptake protein ComE-like DNA-binding protein